MRRWLLSLMLLTLSCDEFQEPLPTAPPPPSPPSFSRYQVVGHWEATTDQARRIAFDVTSEGRVINGRINFHHDCNTGRWRVTLDGFHSDIVDDAFLVTFNWENTEDGLTRTGTMTVSGRFEDDRIVRGAFISGVNDARRAGQPTGDVCPSITGSYVGERE
ncbi:MAG: hypothetical protein ACRD3V_22800 [Vicinamibacteria bacterium]